MKQQKLNSIGALLTQSAKAINGATEVGVGLLVTNTAAAITTDRTAFATANDNFKAGKETLKSKRAVLRSVTATARSFAKKLRGLLEETLGSRYSTAWNLVGFQGSREIPRSSDEVLVLMEGMKTYLTTHEDAQVEELDITPERATGLVTSLLASQKGVDDQRAEVTQLLTTRNNAKKALQQRLRALLEELRPKLSPLDGRWQAFGFNRPGAKETPPVPTNVSVVLVGETAASVKWVASARAEHYRVWKKVTGVDEEFVSVGSPADLDFTMEELPRNSTIEVAVSAVNNGGESGLSHAVSVVTH
jgi:hypothetical protein